MSDRAQKITQEGVQNLMETLDRDHLRRIQGKMHRCAAECCDRSDFTLDQVHKCISNCSGEVSKAETFITSELANFQNRLERCAMTCQDDIRDKIGPKPKESDIDKFKAQFDDCIVKCADSHVKLLPQMLKRMKEVISSGSYTTKV